ncbi:unnamed protein product [Trifolium pratense]|uniref:Uncharacterized protein n=1 Tax=Trifolium pratense TaxID=57577 RepID=A0ACB0KKA5_TRIPR|nr:unnamed protein product [Trifolium pratense]
MVTLYGPNGDESSDLLLEIILFCPNEMIEMKESMNMVAEALREGNEIMRERQKYDLPPISGEETWNLIEGCGCEAASLPEIYCAVMNDVNKLRMILQCPLEARKAVIMQLVFGSSN